MRQGAWVASGVKDLSGNQLRGVSRPKLRELYLDKTWAPSVYIDDMQLVNGDLQINV